VCATRTSSAGHATGRPFYQGISYLLVSMECPIGAAYTQQVEAAGLAGTVRPAMGRVDADFVDWRIGRCSHYAQLWIDRNFALDYTLTSLEKLLDGGPYRAVRAARTVVKDAAYAVLDDLRERLGPTVAAVAPLPPAQSRTALEREYRRWRISGSRGLINAADPCGT
jgi:hypothetical protein